MNISRRKIALIAIIAVILIPFIYTYYAYSTIKVSNKGADEFYQALIEVVSQNEPLEMSDLTPFEWDTMVVFYPYTSRDAMEEKLGRQWTTHSYPGYYLVQKSFLGKYPLDDDSFNKLVFIKDEEVVLDVTFNRSKVDLTQLQDTIEKEEARFVVQDHKLYQNKSDAQP